MGLEERVKQLFGRIANKSLKLLRFSPFAAIGLLGYSIITTEDFREETYFQRMINISNHDFEKISPSAKKIAFSTGDLYVSGMNGENPERLTKTSEREKFLKWSPDGKKILFERNKTLLLIDLLTRKETKVFVGNTFYERFSPTSNTIAFNSENGTLNFFDVKKQTTTKIPNAYISLNEWNEDQALFTKGKNLWKYSPESLEEITREAVGSYDWAGDSIVYTTTKNPETLNVIERTGKKTIKLPFKPASIIGTNGFVSLIKSAKEKTDAYVLDLASEKLSHVISAPKIRAEWNNHLLSINTRSAKRLAYLSDHIKHDDVYVYDASQKKLKKLTREGSELFYRWLPNNKLLITSDNDSRLFPVVITETYALSLEGKLERLTWTGTRKEDIIIDYYATNLIPLGALALLSLLGVYASWRARKARKRTHPLKGLNKIFDHPEILSLAASTAIMGGGIIYTLPYSDHLANYELLTNLKYPENLVVLGYTASGIASFWPIINAVTDLSSRLKNPVRDYFSMLGISASGMYKTLLGKDATSTFKKGLELLAVEYDGFYENKASIAVREGRLVPDALRDWNAGLRWRKRKPYLSRVIHTNWVNSTGFPLAALLQLRYNSQKLKNDPDNAGLLTERQFTYLSLGKNKKAKQLAERILSQQCTQGEKILQSFVLDMIEEHEWAEKLREEVFSQITTDDPQKAFGGLIYPKKGSPEMLQKEASLLRQAQSIGEKHNFESAEPFSIHKIKNNHYLFEVFSDGEQLYKLLEKIPDERVLKEALRVQALLHSKLENNSTLSLDESISKLSKRAPWELRTEFLNAIKELQKVFWKYQAFDCDGHRENRHWNVSNQITVYDLEDRGPAPLAYDYAKLLRQGKRVGSQEQEREMLCAAAQTYNKHAKTRVPERELQEFVWKASPVKALSYAWYAWDDPKKYGVSMEFLENAKDDLNILKAQDKISKAQYVVIVDEIKKTTDSLVQKLRA